MLLLLVLLLPPLLSFPSFSFSWTDLCARNITWHIMTYMVLITEWHCHKHVYDIYVHFFSDGILSGTTLGHSSSCKTSVWCSKACWLDHITSECFIPQSNNLEFGSTENFGDQDLQNFVLCIPIVCSSYQSALGLRLF